MGQNKTYFPNQWDQNAHDEWLNNNHHKAIELTKNRLANLVKLDTTMEQLQLAYYLYFINDYQQASEVLECVVQQDPNQHQALLNLAVCYSRLAQFSKAIDIAQAAIAIKPNYLAYDVLAQAYMQCQNVTQAAIAGTASLVMKDTESAARIQSQNVEWNVPPISPQQWSSDLGKHNVIAFSLWGTQPRYLRGAIQNLLLAPQFFPNWILRFYMDGSVPKSIQELIGKLGGQIVYMPQSNDLRQRLTWRFKVANDPFVGRFLVRDVDSVFTLREKQAVEEWVQSDKYFHVIRDWWTHTDLMLAGLWGGVAGVLPFIDTLLQSYAPEIVETPNIDQWFLRDMVWQYVKQSCLVHDRYFTMQGSIPLAYDATAGSQHIGQNEYIKNEQAQAELLVGLMNRIPNYNWDEVGAALGFFKKVEP